MAEDYCELCDLPLSTCVHGMPPPPPVPEPAPRSSAVRTTRTPAAAKRVPGSSATGKVASRTPSRVTAPEAFRPHILAVLGQAEGPLDTDTVMELLAERMDDVLLDRDRQVAPGGEVRWHTTARKERRVMIDEGLVVAAQPGVWELTEQGSTRA